MKRRVNNMHNYHTTLCPLLRGNAETCNCSDRLTYDQLDDEYKAQVGRIFATSKNILSPYLFLYTVRDGRILARVEMRNEDENE
jgi:ketosteroid isomerase-like protein